MLAPKILLA